MIKNPQTKYQAFRPIDLPDRRWPSRTISAPPIWMSTDLRDGNQALFEPMNRAQKLQMFNMLVEIGFKEIEVAFPAASGTDFDFVRCLIAENRIPNDVTIEVLTQARPHLIERTLESLLGAPKAIVHVYNATNPDFRDIVFNMSRSEVLDLAVRSVAQIRDWCAAHPETQWQLEYSPETFTATELDFALEICNAVVSTWGGSADRKVILNLPATVEVATPNVYADQIEWMDRHLAQRDAVILSVHPHNDRGCAVAAAELAVMAGAERVEGCLFGHGERTGNVDLVTLALNLYSQGIHPGLDFSDLPKIIRTVEACTQLPVAARHPYAGDLVFTAFSGSHQDAIRKGLAQQSAQGPWRVPYLPVDPADLGRSYDSIIRVNSQSGKGGIAYLLETVYGVVLPRRMQVEFSAVVQQFTDHSGSEVDAETLWRIFSQTYLHPEGPWPCKELHLYEEGAAQGIRLDMLQHGQAVTKHGTGAGLLEATVAALGLPIDIVNYEERALKNGAGAQAMAWVEIVATGASQAVFGVGVDCNIAHAGVQALLSATNRLLQQNPHLA